MKVTRIINDCVKSGDNWTQASVELSDGQIVRIFNPVMVGDEVYSEQNGQYTNWKVKHNSNKVSNDIEKLINSMSKDIQTLSRRVDELGRNKNVALPDNFGVSSQVSNSDEMPEDFLKI